MFRWHFYPRPPRGGRPRLQKAARMKKSISIHALREEGDQQPAAPAPAPVAFLSTPSARRATVHPYETTVEALYISIHALREEGDCNDWRKSTIREISIHALREEGDTQSVAPAPAPVAFLSTPSARRATSPIVASYHVTDISIHALREEGDRSSLGHNHGVRHFYPRPPRGGRRKSTTSPLLRKKFLSTPSARRATAEAFRELRT